MSLHHVMSHNMREEFLSIELGKRQHDQLDKGRIPARQACIVSCRWVEVEVITSLHSQEAVVVPSIVLFLSVERGDATNYPIFGWSGYLDEGNFLQGDSPIGLHHLMQRHQRVEHGFNIGLSKVLPARLLQSFMPHLMPQNGHADQLLTDLRIQVSHCEYSC